MTAALDKQAHKKPPNQREGGVVKDNIAGTHVCINTCLHITQQQPKHGTEQLRRICQKCATPGMEMHSNHQSTSANVKHHVDTPIITNHPLTCLPTRSTRTRRLNRPLVRPHWQERERERKRKQKASSLLDIVKPISIHVCFCVQQVRRGGRNVGVCTMHTRAGKTIVHHPGSSACPCACLCTTTQCTPPSILTGGE